MNKDIEITKLFSDTVLKVCVDIVQFTKLYDQNNPNDAKQIFTCNDDVKKGLKLLNNSRSSQHIKESISAYKKIIKSTLFIYKNLTISFKDKDEIIHSLTNLDQHLTELQEQIN